MPRTLAQEIEDFFGISEKSLRQGDKTDWEFSDGRNAGPFIKRLYQAARAKDTARQPSKAKQEEGE